jgi:sugar phosphate isomerase/epimerase
MKLSISTCGTEREKQPDGTYRFDAVKGLRQCAAAGFTYVDFNFAQAAVANRPLSGADWKRWTESVRQTADELHLTVSQTHAHWFYPHLVPAGEVEWNNDMVRRSVEATSMLGENIWMVTHPRSIYDAEGFSLQKTLDYNYAQCMELGELGKKYGVGIAIENLFHVPGRTDYYCKTEELL